MDTPPPPWSCQVTAVAWVHRATPHACEALPPQLQQEQTVPLAAGALLRYVDSPVGPYSEVLAAPLLFRGIVPLGHVPFIAVDSVASRRGGRDHWALPKTLAAFGPDGSVVGEGWSLSVVAKPVGPALPAVLPFAFTQAPGTRARCLFRGRLRLARVVLNGDGLPVWFARGAHLGAMVDGRLRVGSPERTSAARPGIDATGAV